MSPQFNVLEAMLHCSYKAWRLSKEGIISIEAEQQANQIRHNSNSVAIAAWQIRQLDANINQATTVKSSKHQKQALQLLKDTSSMLGNSEPPPFYKISHCSECQFKRDCYKKLIDRDCISLLPVMSAKSMLKYHSKGITTITQMSHLFKPRRRRAPNPRTLYLWELKALAIREQKTFVIQAPVLNHTATAIYLDFEGTSDEKHIYLLGGLVIHIGKPEEVFSFWSDTKADEQANFNHLFELLLQFPDAEIYHYGSYESKALKLAAKKSPFLKYWPALETRMVNLLGFLRTHVYPAYL